jgi:hypothetical protein
MKPEPLGKNRIRRFGQGTEANSGAIESASVDATAFTKESG